MKASTLLLGLIFSTKIFASNTTDNTWMSNLRNQGINSADQSYCYVDDKGNVEGKNVDMKIRLASTSKLIVSLWSIEKLGIKHTFDTKLYIKGNNLHLKGSYDPFLSNEKMFYLISQLNELGYNHFDKITFDKDVMIFPDAPYLIDEHPDMSRANHVKLISKYFNTAKWSQDFKDEYRNFKSMAKDGMYRSSVEFTVDNVEFVESNPLENEADVKTLTLSSPSLYKYLKEMNVKSNNYVSETLFRMLGNGKGSELYLMSKLNVNRDTMKMWTGSGLPYFNEAGTRLDNYSNCSTMLKVLEELKNETERQDKKIEDVLAVPGSDKGTFRNRIFPEDFKNSFTAKTGTLMHTSALAGAMNTQTGFSFFGVFNQTTDIHGAKAVQNEMVKSIMTDLGGPKSFEYTVEPFHTYNGDVLKSNIFMDLSTERFSTVEGSLN